MKIPVTQFRTAIFDRWASICTDGKAVEAENCVIKDEKTANYALYTIDHRIVEYFNGDNEIMKKIIYQLFTAIIIFSICIVSPVKAYDEQFYSSNDILFYNSEDTGTNCSSLINSDEIYSATIIEKQKAIAEFLTTTNFKHNNNQPLNAVQMAAVLGNLITESQTLDPQSGVADNASHKGIGQWTSPGPLGYDS